MEALSRVVAGPVALSSLGAAILDEAPVASGVLWTFALVWAAVALLDWRRTSFTLAQRALRLANRVRRCMPNWWKEADYMPHSSYGDDASLANVVVAQIRWQQRLRSRLPRPQRRYTARLQRRVVAMIEELGAHGITDYNLKPYLSRRPKHGEYEPLARELWWESRRLG